MARVDLTDKLSDARARIDAETLEPHARDLPMFERMVRKDARVRPDQDAALTALAKSLMRRRPAKAERITENTLIRVAVDLLLAHADQLRGSTEDDLRSSATSALPHFRTSDPSESHTPDAPQFSAPKGSSSGGAVAAQQRSPGVAYSRTPELRSPAPDAPHSRGPQAGGFATTRRTGAGPAGGAL